MISGLIWIGSGIGIALIGRLQIFGGLSERLGRTIILICAAAFIGSGVYIAVAQRQRVADAGFESSSDMFEAKRAGFTDAEAWKAEKLKRSSQTRN
jgi:hypothetical protein